MVSVVSITMLILFSRMVLMCRVADLDRKKDLWAPYQQLPLEIATPENALNCRLITLSISPSPLTNTPLQNIWKIHSSLVSFLATATQRLLYTGLYSHSTDAQPGSLPKIGKGEHGDGDWIVCVLISGDADKKLKNLGLPGVEGQVDEWIKRMKFDGSMEGIDIKSAVWDGDVFMS